MTLYKPDIKAAHVTVKRLRRGRERSSRYHLMNDDVPVNYSAAHNTRDGTQHKTQHRVSLLHISV